MKVLPSTSVTRAPDARAMKCGEPPTAAKARTGEFTPPGKSVCALAKSVADLRAGFTNANPSIHLCPESQRRAGPSAIPFSKLFERHAPLRANFKRSPDCLRRKSSDPVRERPCRLLPGRLAVVENDLAVDDDGVDADGILKRIVEGGVVGDRPGSNITRSAALPASSVPRSANENARRQRRHLSNRLNERNHRLLAHVSSQNAREGAETARMRHARAKRAFVASADPSDPMATHGCFRASFRSSSEMMKYDAADAAATPRPSKSKTKSNGSLPASFAASAMRMPSYCGSIALVCRRRRASVRWRRAGCSATCRPTDSGSPTSGSDPPSRARMRARSGPVLAAARPSCRCRLLRPSPESSR